MTIYKRYIDLECTASQIKEVTSITIPNGIEISVDFRASWFRITLSADNNKYSKKVMNRSFFL